MLKKLFSGLFGGGAEAAPKGQTRAAEPVEHNGFLIISQPDNSSGQYRVSGWIRKEVGDGVLQEHRFERSDMLPGREACDAMMVTKAQRYIEEVGEGMFAADPRDESTS